jgi:hypothetical protein
MRRCLVHFFISLQILQAVIGETSMSTSVAAVAIERVSNDLLLDNISQVTTVKCESPGGLAPEPSHAEVN